MMASPLSHVELYLESAGLLDTPGKVLYSSEATLCRGPVYLLGLNPGGSEGATLRDSVAQSRSGHNAYLNEQWAPGHVTCVACHSPGILPTGDFSPGHRELQASWLQ